VIRTRIRGGPKHPAPDAEHCGQLYFSAEILYFCLVQKSFLSTVPMELQVKPNPVKPVPVLIKHKRRLIDSVFL
jgi:hypothetical protein